MVSNELAKDRNPWKLFIKTLLNNECVINDLGYLDTSKSIKKKNIFHTPAIQIVFGGGN